MRQFEQIIALHDADPQAWKAHVQAGNISTQRLPVALMVADFWAVYAETQCKAEALRIVAPRHGFKKYETARNHVRKLSNDC